MIAVALLGLALLVDGHHPLPAAPSAAPCDAALASLRAVLRSGSRPQRLRALVLLTRCSARVDWAPLLVDPDGHIRHAATLHSLRRIGVEDHRWEVALRRSSRLQRAAILRIRRARRMALEREAR
jgi:hypothetical protein